MIPSFSKKMVICFSMCSRSLHTVLVSEIGRKLDGLFLLPDLCTGTTFADFQSCGRTHDDNYLLNIIQRYFAVHSAYHFKKVFGILCGQNTLFPFLVSRFTRRFSTPASMTVRGLSLLLTVMYI